MNEEANKLFVEAVLLIRQSDELAANDIETSYKKGSDALQKLDNILANYPGSNVAVEIVLGRTPVDLEKMAQIRTALARQESILVAIESPKAFVLFIAKQAGKQPIDVPLRNIAFVLTSAEFVEDAMNLAVQMDAWSDYVVQVLSGIAAATAQTGNTQVARELCRKALQKSAEIESPELKDEALSDIAWAFAKTGALDQALGVADQIAPGECKERSLSRAYTALAEAGEIEVVLNAATSFGDKGRTWAEIGIAEMLHAKGKNERASEIFRTAIDSACNITYRYAGDLALSRIVANLTEAGDIDLATSVVEKINTPSIKAEAWNEVASALFEKGETDKANDLFWTALSGADHSSRREEVLNRIIARLARIGDLEFAWRVRTHFRVELTDAALECIALALGKGGDIEQALSVVTRIRDEGDPKWEFNACRLRSSIALGMALRAKRGGGSDTFSQAIRDAEDIEIAADATRALIFIAARLVQAGGIAKAREVARRAWNRAAAIEDDDKENDNEDSDADEISGLERAVVRRVLEYVWVAFGNDCEFDLFDTYGSEDGWNTVMLINIAETLLRQGDLKAAWSIAEEIADVDERLSLLSKVAWPLAIQDTQLKQCFDRDERAIAIAIVSAFQKG